MEYRRLRFGEDPARDEAYLAALQELSQAWAEEKSCPAYYANDASEFLEKEAYVAEDDGRVAAYALGHAKELTEKTSYNRVGETAFELDEIYVAKEYRGRGVGKALFRFVEENARGRADVLALIAASYRYGDLLRFYIDELGMTFNHALLVKRLRQKSAAALGTRRLNIRYVDEGDWQRLIEIWEDFERSPYGQYDVPHDADPAATRAKAKRWAAASPQGEHIFYAVCRGQEMLGYIDFHKTPEGYECGYCFHSRYHGQGYARESLTALVRHLAGNSPTRFTAGTALNNLPSVRLLSAAGFRKIGEERVSFYRDERGEPIWFDGGVFALDVNGEEIGHDSAM